MARDSRFPATRRRAEGLRHAPCGHFSVEQTSRPSVKPALSPHRIGALRGSGCLAPWAATSPPGDALQARVPRNAMSSLGHFLWVTFLLGQQKKSDSSAGRRSKRPLRKRHPCHNAQLSRYREAPSPHPSLPPKGRRSTSRCLAPSSGHPDPQDLQPPHKHPPRHPQASGNRP
jgi:hypothetical protein